jgi:hypothetical protein
MHSRTTSPRLRRNAATRRQRNPAVTRKMRVHAATRKMRSVAVAQTARIVRSAKLPVVRPIARTASTKDSVRRTARNNPLLSILSIGITTFSLSAHQ